MAFEVKLTDAEHAAKIKDIVMELNEAAMKANDGGLEVVFDTFQVRLVKGADINRVTVTVTVRRPL